MRENRVCPVARAGSLDNRIRKLFQNPGKILAPYVKKNMSVLDLGCGPGFFSVELARLVGDSGQVIACDLQQGMLEKLAGKIRGTKLEERIILHKCETDRIGVDQQVDFVLAFYMVHEIPDKARFFTELVSILNSGGTILLVEPPFHVSRKSFDQTVATARNARLSVEPGPGIMFSKTALLIKP